MKQAASLETRAKPVQDRARRRVSDILDAAQALLQDGDKVTTSTIAARAEIPVGSVYRYFPNIDSIYSQLFQRLSNELKERLSARPEQPEPDTSWESSLEQSLAASLDFIRTNTAYGILLYEMSTPTVEKIELTAVHELSQQLMRRWQAGHDGFHSGDMEIVAQTYSRLFAFVEQCYFDHLRGRSDAEIYREAQKALKAYIALYLA